MCVLAESQEEIFYLVGTNQLYCSSLEVKPKKCKEIKWCSVRERKMGKRNQETHGLVQIKLEDAAASWTPERGWEREFWVHGDKILRLEVSQSESIIPPSLAKKSKAQNKVKPVLYSISVNITNHAVSSIIPRYLNLCCHASLRLCPAYFKYLWGGTLPCPCPSICPWFRFYPSCSPM